MPPIDKKKLIGKKLGRLTLVSVNGKDKNGKSLCSFLCDCGCIKENVVLGQFINGRTRSCGCIKSPKNYEYIEKTKNRILNSIKEENGCWVWQKKFHDKCNYGVMGWIFKGKKKQWMAHRVSFSVFKQEIPEGIFVLHSCDNSKCVNPDHLHLGTQKDNMREMRERGRDNDISRGRCGENHGMSKLTEDQVSEIRSLRKQGVYGTEIAKKFNVTNTLIYLICNNKIWKNIKD